MSGRRVQEASCCWLPLSKRKFSARCKKPCQLPLPQPLLVLPGLVPKRICNRRYPSCFSLWRVWSVPGICAARPGDGLALLSGRSRAYGYRQRERFLTDWTQAGGAARMTELLATWTAQTWKTPGTIYYLDGHRKAVFSDYLIARGLIGRTGPHPGVPSAHFAP